MKYVSSDFQTGPNFSVPNYYQVIIEGSSNYCIIFIDKHDTLISNRVTPFSGNFSYPHGFISIISSRTLLETNQFLFCQSKFVYINKFLSNMVIRIKQIKIANFISEFETEIKRSPSGYRISSSKSISIHTC